MGKWITCVFLGVYTDTHLLRVRHSALSQFTNLTLDVSGMQHRALCKLALINASSFVSLVFTQNNCIHI